MDATRNTPPLPSSQTSPQPSLRQPDGAYRIALLYPGDRTLREAPDVAHGRFANVCGALTAAGGQGVRVEAAIWHDDFRDEVAAQLMQVDAVLVWCNPIEDGRDRGVLDAMLREVAGRGVFVSTHPDVILKLGTKEVLYTTRELGWGTDTQLYSSLDEMRRQLPARLREGAPRVLKQYRGNGGSGVWKVEAADADAAMVTVRHAKRGCFDETLPLADFLTRCEPYFAGSGRMIDQAYQPRLPEGMVRCYLVHGQVAGFGLQAVNALYPADPGAAPESALQPSPRLYHPPTLPQYQAFKQQLERDWIPAMQGLLGIATHELPILWDCDFLLGPKDAAGQDSYVLCEINVSSVSPFPDSALIPIAQATLARAQAVQRKEASAA